MGHFWPKIVPSSYVEFVPYLRAGTMFASESERPFAKTLKCKIHSKIRHMKNHVNCTEGQLAVLSIPVATVGCELNDAK